MMGLSSFFRHQESRPWREHVGNWLRTLETMFWSAWNILANCPLTPGTNELLQSAQRDLGKLSLLETASSGVYPQLNASASLKQLRINLDAQTTANFKPTYALKIQRTDLSFSDPTTRRSHGAYSNPSTSRTENVLVEWVEYDKEDLDARLNTVRRVDDLAKCIRSASNRHPDLHTL